MENDLRQRLEALSAEATSGLWDNTGTHGQPTDFGVYAPQGRSICSTGGFADGKDITYRQNVANAQYIVAASNAFRSGDLVTRQEMEEAVAKAVAEEREACVNIAERVRLENEDQASDAYTNEEERYCRGRAYGARDVWELIRQRARSSNKEGE